MAAPKRKAENGAPVKKEAGASTDRSAKRQRKSDVGTDDAKPAKAPAAKADIAPKKSVFADGEKAFPRGGASVLTPLEHKQIQIKATQDVLFEQAGGVKKKGGAGLSDDEGGSDVDMEDAPKAGKKRKSKKGKKDVQEEEAGIKVEGLSYKVRLGDPLRDAKLTRNRD